MKDYYIAQDAAKVLGLEYHTFMARVRKGLYPYEKPGRDMFFLKTIIDKAAAEEKNVVGR
jgi:hypothetical protein